MSSAARKARRAGLQKPVADAKTGDSYQNLQARLGIGADNLSNGSNYALNPITRQRAQLEAMYRGSWIVGAAVDAPADDMVRAGVEITSSIDPGDAQKLHAAFDRLNIWGELSDGLRWSRLYGGAIVVMLIDGQPFDAPFRPETVAKGQFKGLMALDRWQLDPVLGKVVTEFGPHFGKPEYYTVVMDKVSQAGSASPLLGQRIHYSRVFRFEGARLPFYQRVAEMGWGMSVLERLYDRLVAFDSTTQGASQLVFKAHLRTMAVEGLQSILATGGPAYEALIKRLEGIRRFQSSEGLTVIDAKDRLENYSYTFSGLGDMMLQFAQQISGALQIPLVRLLGQSPAGLNSTGESDLRTYYDGISRDQEKFAKAPLVGIFDVLHRSELSREMEPDFDFEFRPLWQMSDIERADIAQKTTAAILDVHDAGLVGPQTTLRELKKSSHVTGVFASITEEQINAAEVEPPDPSEIEPDDPFGPNGEGENNAPPMLQQPEPGEAPSNT